MACTQISLKTTNFTEENIAFSSVMHSARKSKEDLDNATDFYSTTEPTNETQINPKENFGSLFAMLNVGKFNEDLGKVNATDSYSATGSTNETQISLKTYLTKVNYVITRIISKFKDKLILPEQISYVFDKYTEFYLISQKRMNDTYNRFSDDFIVPHINYQPFEYFFYQLKNRVPDFEIYAETIDKIAGGIQFNQISHTTVSNKFIDMLIKKEFRKKIKTKSH